MPDDDKPDPKPDPNPSTFTQADIDRIVAERVNRERAKFSDYDALKDKATKFDQLDAATKSDIDKANERATAAEKRAADAEAKALRLEVATAKGLTSTQARRLVGATKEELEADADDLLSSFKPADGNGDGGDGKPTPSNRPSENLRGGGDPTQEAEETNPAKLAAQIPRG